MNKENLLDQEILDILSNRGVTIGNFSNEELIDIVFSDKYDRPLNGQPIKIAAAMQTEWQRGYAKYSIQEIFRIHNVASLQWPVTIAAINTGNLTTEQMFALLLADKYSGHNCARTFMYALKLKLLSITPDLDSVKLISGLYSRLEDIHADCKNGFYNKSYSICEPVIQSLKNVVHESANFDELSIENLYKIMSISKFEPNIVEKAVKTTKFSADSLIAILFLGHLNSKHNFALQYMIDCGKLSKKQIVTVLNRCGHDWPIAKRAIATKLFSSDEMRIIFKKSFCDKDVAYAIHQTGLASKELKELISQFL